MPDDTRGSCSGPTIQEAKRALSRRLLRNPGVSGVGIETAEGGGERIKVYLAEDNPGLASSIPSAVEGYSVVVEVIGRIRPRPGAGGHARR